MSNSEKVSSQLLDNMHADNQASALTELNASYTNKASNMNTSDINTSDINTSDIKNNVIKWINSRRSIANLTEPAPSEQEVKTAIQCAMTAPDHKKLKPWRFIVLQGESRRDMGHALLKAAEAKALRENTNLDDITRDKTLKMPLRAPMIITVVTRIQYHEKVPQFEQLLSTGAAVQNLILALKAQGYNTVWRTGLLCNEPAVKSYFNVGAEDYIAAFIYVGSSAVHLPKRNHINTESFVQFK